MYLFIFCFCLLCIVWLQGWCRRSSKAMLLLFHGLGDSIPSGYMVHQVWEMMNLAFSLSLIRGNGGALRGPATGLDRSRGGGCLQQSSEAPTSKPIENIVREQKTGDEAHTIAWQRQQQRSLASISTSNPSCTCTFWPFFCRFSRFFSVTKKNLLQKYENL